MASGCSCPIAALQHLIANTFEAWQSRLEADIKTVSRSATWHMDIVGEKAPIDATLLPFRTLLCEGIGADGQDLSPQFLRLKVKITRWIKIGQE